MAITRNIYFQDDVAQKLEGIVGLSKLINDLLRDYFLDDEKLINEKKENLSKEIKQLEEKTEELKLEKQEKEKQETQEKEAKEILSSIELPDFMVEWLKVRSERPGLLEVVGKLKAESLPVNEEMRNKVWEAWEKLHNVRRD